MLDAEIHTVCNFDLLSHNVRVRCDNAHLCIGRYIRRRAFLQVWIKWTLKNCLLFKRMKVVVSGLLNLTYGCAIIALQIAVCAHIGAEQAFVLEWCVRNRHAIVANDRLLIINEANIRYGATQGIVCLK